MLAMSDFFKLNEQSHVTSIPGVLSDSSEARISKDITSKVYL